MTLVLKSSLSVGLFVLCIESGRSRFRLERNVPVATLQARTLALQSLSDRPN